MGKGGQGRRGKWRDEEKGEKRMGKGGKGREGRRRGGEEVGKEGIQWREGGRVEKGRDRGGEERGGDGKRVSPTNSWSQAYQNLIVH